MAKPILKIYLLKVAGLVDWTKLHWTGVTLFHGSQLCWMTCVLGILNPNSVMLSQVEVVCTNEMI